MIKLNNLGNGQFGFGRTVTDDDLAREKFESNLDRIQMQMREIQDRLNELEEFEKQYRELYESIGRRIGKPSFIHQRSFLPLRNYRWDRYHVLVSDLFSLVENELCSKNDNSLSKHLVRHLRVRSVESYIIHDYRISFTHNPRHPWTLEEKRVRTEEAKLADAKAARSTMENAMRTLFPKISESFEATELDLKTYRSQLHQLRDQLSSLRQIFNHKFEEDAIRTHSPALKNLSVSYIQSVADGSFRLIQAITTLFQNKYFSKWSTDFRQEISDQIDLMLFGSIAHMHFLFYDGEPSSTPYELARQKFINSDRFIEYVVADVNSPNTGE